MNFIDPESFFNLKIDKNNSPNQRQSEFNSFMQSRKTSSLVIDGLEESSILFNSDIKGLTESDSLNELNGLRESLLDNQESSIQKKINNRRETLKIFKKNKQESLKVKDYILEVPYSSSYSSLYIPFKVV